MSQIIDITFKNVLMKAKQKKIFTTHTLFRGSTFKNAKCHFFRSTLFFIGLIIHSTTSSGQNPVWSENFESIATSSNYFGITSAKILANGGVNNSKCVEVEYERYENGGTPRYLHKYHKIVYIPLQLQ